MTRSTISPYHPRVAKKVRMRFIVPSEIRPIPSSQAFRAKARQEGMTFRVAAEARTMKQKVSERAEDYSTLR
jgi:hypothetical protein